MNYHDDTATPPDTYKPTLTVSDAHRTEEKQSRKIVREAKQVLSYSDSTFSDQLNALRVLIFVTLEHPRSSRLAWYISIFLVACILLNAISFMVGTIPSTLRHPTTCADPVCEPGPTTFCTEVVCRPRENRIIWHLELWTIVIFTIDYLLRVFCVPAVPVDLVFPRSLEYTIDGRLKDRSNYYRMDPCKKTTKYMLSGLNIIDVISIVPFYVYLLAPYPAIRVFRFLRFLLIFKLGRRFREAGAIISRTLRASLPALLIFVFLTTVLAIVFGSMMFYFEGGIYSVTMEFPAGGFLRPNDRNTALEQSPFQSIFTGVYWYVVNTTTLGNANLYPTTTGGRIASCFIAYCGLLSLALPITIIGQNFSQQYNLVYADPDMQPHLFYPSTPHTPRTPKGGPSQTPGRKGLAPGTRDGFRSKMGGEKQDIDYVPPEQEIEALRAHFQQQIDALRLHVQGSTAASAAPAQQEVDALRSYVQREIGSLKMSLNDVQGRTPRASEESDTTASRAFSPSNDGRNMDMSRSSNAGAQRRREQEEEEDREHAAQQSLRDAEINRFRNQITEGIRRFSPQAELESLRGGLY
ncbi:Ion transport [Nannochloropsis gaditana]|uniref:Ion transport n=1 Tax=Nannochloropsis gaditana TaxID=72520 RepID=W7TUB3_9STRA|nr:Ion transport [Nannochloropsis gaditana]